MPSPAKLTNREIQKLHEGLVALDGVAGSGGSLLRFDFDDKVVWDIVRNRAAVEPLDNNVTRAVKALGAKYGIVEGVKLTPDNAEQAANYMHAVEMLLDQEQEVPGLITLKLSALQKAGVKIPGVIAKLQAILEA